MKQRPEERRQVCTRNFLVCVTMIGNIILFTSICNYSFFIYMNLKGCVLSIVLRFQFTMKLNFDAFLCRRNDCTSLYCHLIKHLVCLFAYQMILKLSHFVAMDCIIMNNFIFCHIMPCHIHLLFHFYLYDFRLYLTKMMSG